MKVALVPEKWDKHKADVLILGVCEGEKAEAVDKQLGGALSEAVKAKEFTGEYKQLFLVPAPKLAARKLLLAGLGKSSELSIERLRRVAGAAAKYARSCSAKTIATTLHETALNDTIAARVSAVAEGVLLGLYQFTEYKTDKTGIKAVDSLALLGDDSADARRAVAVAEALAAAVNYARDLVNTPANIITPTRIAEEANKIAKENKLKITVLGRKEMEKLGMNALLSVARGSVQEPKLIITEYNPAGKETIVIVGKGITFDSGGLDLKPAAYMEEMKTDKAGACAVLSLMKAVTALKVRQRVIGVMPMTENMPGSNASKPGDIVSAYNKKTIEIMNTDAEGRLVLADAISYAEKVYKPRAIIDLATLTGACVVALGYYAAGMLGNDEALMSKVRAAAEKSGERVWQLPLWDDYKELVKGELADVKNAERAGSMGPGAINGAAFISNFVGSTPWVHLDIAGTARYPEEKEYVPKGATGYGVRLMAQLLLDWEK